MCSRGHLARWPRCRSGSGHSSLATWGGWPGLIGVLEGCRTICVGVVRSDLIVCGPSVAPMWPQPVWSEVLGQGAAVTQVLGGDRTPAGSRCSELRPAAAGPIPGPSMPPTTRWGDASAGHLPGEPPTCGGNPRTSVWRAADPCRAGASCRPQGPTTTSDRTLDRPSSASPRSCLQHCLHLDRRSHIRRLVVTPLVSGVTGKPRGCRSRRARAPPRQQSGRPCRPRGST
jgi:hypothetical protein